MSLLSLDNLNIAFHSRHGLHRAVDDVSLTVGRGEILGVVGESGSGKSVTCLSLVGLLGHGAEVSGRMTFEGKGHEIADLPRLAHGARPSIGMIFQDPAASLNPVRTIGSQIAEVLRFGRGMNRKAARAEAVALLDRVGIKDPEARLSAYPHQMSGGMNQRVMIAMALAGQPKLLVADEPTTALDVTIQAQICKLLRDLVRDTGLSIVFISHDLDLVAQLCDRVAVMFGGHLLETQSARDVVARPQHAYTRALLAAIPGHQPPRTRLGVITDTMRAGFLKQGEAA